MLVISNFLAWVIITAIILIYYKKLEDKPRLWKALLIAFIGMFTFNFDLNILQTLISIPILPLGVWLLMIIFRNKEDRWNVYRPFAWLGFFSQFIFILTVLISMPLNNLLYPQDQLSTYISNAEDASLISTHSSGEETSLKTGSLNKVLEKMEQNPIYSHEWYHKMSGNFDNMKVDEKFPYVLIGTDPKWGSGIESVIYLERDGRGLLVTSQKGQHYFRSEESLLEEGSQ
ncbi:hypothetical protein [Halalkalibacillus sediminis]|uniref:hypothetical protein n=1 Tax=Halalkalibacillus sediminis TaxID=2018042 RepID=UPI00117B7FF7|nr:hypothetical protein [Halalkalibacillus sediminis]